jgi:hypothetical protein
MGTLTPSLVNLVAFAALPAQILSSATPSTTILALLPMLSLIAARTILNSLFPILTLNVLPLPAHCVIPHALPNNNVSMDSAFQICTMFAVGHSVTPSPSSAHPLKHAAMAFVSRMVLPLPMLTQFHVPEF